MADNIKNRLNKVDDFTWVIPQDYKKGMRVPGMIFANEQMIKNAITDGALEQVVNVAFLPGIVRYSFGMPDIHRGYGLPIGGVAPIDYNKGVISPGGVGSDINCGVRLIKTDLTQDDIKEKIKELVNAIYDNVPCGVGSTGKIYVKGKELHKVLQQGSKWAVSQGYGWDEDVEHTEENGALPGADPDTLSTRALERGYKQIGTLGAGNHFLEVQVVDEIFDQKVANALGIFKGQITVMIHTGSRGLGYQVCQDYVRTMGKAMNKYGISLPDRELAACPINSPEGERYYAAMACAANYAWANRQAIMHWVRQAFEKVFDNSAQRLGMRLIYDVAHNIGKIETHIVDGKKMKLLIHRKGATRAFGPGHPALPSDYKPIGQPVIIPGDMGRYSYLLVGTEQAMSKSFGSTCHGAGRKMSRRQAVKQTRGMKVEDELANKGIYVRARGWRTLHEEVSEAYKDVSQVVDIVAGVGISQKVARMRPLGVVKG